MKFRNLRYYIMESILSIIRNRLMSVASIITVACCIFVLTFSYCVVANVDHILKSVEDDMKLSVYVLDEIADEEIAALKNKILAIEHVTGASYVSSEEAMAAFGAEYTENSDFFAGLTDEAVNILPRSFDISVDNIIYQDQVRSELEKYVGQYFEKVRYSKESIDVLIGINNVIRIVSILVILFLSIISIIIIMNTIKLTVNNRQSEINIMKYVGATDWFIRWPFIIEGMVIGLLGALLPVVMCLFGYGGIINYVNEKFPAITVIVEFLSTNQVFIFLLPFALILGVLIGAIGSVTSIRKHLHV